MDSSVINLEKDIFIRLWREETTKKRDLNESSFEADDNSFVFTLTGLPLHTLAIHFTNNWLEKQLPAHKIARIKSATEHDPGETHRFFSPLSSSGFEMALQAVEKIETGDWDYIFLRSRILTLLDELIRSFITIMEKGELHSSAHYAAIAAIEGKLVSALTSQPPDIEALAKEFSISLSTMRRWFKEKYGKSPYEYYLNRKMELGAKLLIEEKLSVSEVAYRLGYEKPGSFIEIFRKYYGVSPGSIDKDHQFP